MAVLSQLKGRPNYRYYEFADRFTRHLLTEYGLTRKIVFSEARGSKVRSWGQADRSIGGYRIDREEIWYGWVGIDRIVADGWTEYKSAAYYYPYLSGAPAIGFKAVYFLVCHEFAHVLDHLGNGMVRRWGESHPRSFWRHLEEVHTLFPWDEMAEQFGVGHEAETEEEIVTPRAVWVTEIKHRPGLSKRLAYDVIDTATGTRILYWADYGTAVLTALQNETYEYRRTA